MALQGALRRAVAELRRGFRMGNVLPTSVGLSNDAAVNQIQVGSNFYFDVKGWDASLKEVLGHHRGLQNKCEEIISDNCVVIFSKTTCVYCKMAKKLFEDMNVNYTTVELDMNTNGSQFQDILEQMTGGRTVPRVFVNGTFVGGATDTQRLHEGGKLLPLVHQCQEKRKS